ncbi:hypothetical protein [Spiroplasma endosymbiont of Dilophus febrilis]|uniref:hypothetical protein n=2 Tax=unclassified Spiroplasma TaxID=2637901 RepID=UPI00313B0983
MKENNIYELKNEIIVNFSELLLKEVALTYLDLLRKYQKGDAHHLILEFLNVSVLLLDKVIVDEKLWDKTDTSLLLDLKNSIFLAEKGKEKRLTKALETTKKAYKYLFIKLNFLFSLIKDKDMQEKLFLDIYNIYVKGFENKQIIFSDVINDYSKKLNRKRKFLTFNIDELNYFWAHKVLLGG